MGHSEANKARAAYPTNRRVLGRSRFGVGLALVLVVGVVAGCGGGRKGEVSGTISYQGKPLPSGEITFFNNDKQIVGGASIRDGKYKASSLPPGPVKITVNTSGPDTSVDKKAVPQSEGKPISAASIDIPPRYSTPDQSDLTYEVKPGVQEHPIELK